MREYSGAAARPRRGARGQAAGAGSARWGRLGIDATAPFARRAEFERKRVPGADTLDLGAYLT